MLSTWALHSRPIWPGTNTLRLAIKAGHLLNFIRINLKQAPRNFKDILYNANVHSTLEYAAAAAAWDLDTKAFINRLELIQNRAACFVTGSCNTNTIKSTTLYSAFHSSIKLSLKKMGINCHVYLKPPACISRRRGNSKIIREVYHRTPLLKSSFLPLEQAAQWRCFCTWCHIWHHSKAPSGCWLLRHFVTWLCHELVPVIFYFNYFCSGSSAAPCDVLFHFLSWFYMIFFSALQCSWLGSLMTGLSFSLREVSFLLNAYMLLLFIVAWCLYFFLPNTLVDVQWCPLGKCSNLNKRNKK